MDALCLRAFRYFTRPYRALYFNGAAHGIQYAVELGLQAIAGHMPGPITPQRIPPRIYMGGYASFLRLTLSLR